MGLLEQEALKKEQGHEQKNAQKTEGGIKISRQVIARLSIVILSISIVGTIYSLYPESFSLKHIGDITNEVKMLFHLEDEKISTPPQVIQEPELPLRSNDEWVERQTVLLNQNTGNS